MLNPSLHNKWHQLKTYNEGSQHSEEDQNPVYLFTAFNSTGAYLSVGDCVDPVSVIAPQIVLLHSEESQEALNRERLARYAISPVIDDECNIVELQKHTEIE